MTLEFISPRAHAVLDYVTVAVQAVAPRLLGLERQTGHIHKAVLTATAGYSLLTNYPGGAYKVLPMKTHLAMDALAGVGFLAAAFVKRQDRLARSTLAGMGLLSLAAAFCTKVPKRAQRIGPQVSGLPARGDSPMQRYAREQRPKPTTSTAQHWPEFLQKQVMAEPAVEAAKV